MLLLYTCYSNCHMYYYIHVITIYMLFQLSHVLYTWYSKYIYQKIYFPLSDNTLITRTKLYLQLIIQFVNNNAKKIFV